MLSKKRKERQQEEKRAARTVVKEVDAIIYDCLFTL